MAFSKQWTDDERLKIIMLLAAQIQTDIPAGNYGAAIGPQIDDGMPTMFRPNMQSILEIIAMPTEILEEQRESLEQYVREQLAEIGESEEQFYETNLAEQRQKIIEASRPR